MEHCPNFSGYLVGRGIAPSVSGKALLVRMRCRNWSCEFCAEKNRSIWRARIIRSTQSGEWFMMTITASAKDRTPKGSLRNLQYGWAKKELNWFNFITREWVVSRGLYGFMHDQNPDSPFDYVKVFEPHKNGAIHAHFLTNYHFIDYRHPRETKKFSPKGKRIPLYGSRALKDASVYFGMGFEVQTRHIGDNAGLAASYVTKYLTKELANLPHGTHRIITSRNFLVPDEEKTSDFEWSRLVDFHIGDFYQLKMEGYSLYDVNLKHTVKSEDFPSTMFYTPQIK